MISCSCHLSNQKHALTTTHSVSSVSKHNLRLYKEQQEYNVALIEIVEGSGTSILDDVKRIYKEEFSEPLREYNEGKRADRQIKDYLKYVSDNKKSDVAAEVILQIGDKEFWSQKSIEQWKEMSPFLTEQLEAFKKAVPEFKVASAVIHLDESSPHMQVVGVPVATGYKRGMSKQVAKSKVFTKERMVEIQAIMHADAERIINEHPEIFGHECLKPIEKGRNNDMSKEFYIRMKQAEYEAISEDVSRLEDEKESLIKVKSEVSIETEKMINEAVDKIAETKLQKEFLQLAVDENAQSFWGKTISDVFKKFKEWWFTSRGLEVVEKTKTSIMERLKEAQKIADEHNSQHKRKPKKKEYEQER